MIVLQSETFRAPSVVFYRRNHRSKQVHSILKSELEIFTGTLTVTSIGSPEPALDFNGVNVVFPLFLCPFLFLKECA